MSLNESKFRYLKRNGRSFKMGRDEVVVAFDALGLSQIEVFIDFQTQFAGYRPEADLTYGLFDPTGGSKDFAAPRAETRDGTIFMRCDLQNLLQIRFWMDETGRFYEDDFPVAVSFESYIRFQSYRDRTLTAEAWIYIDPQRLATKRFAGFFDERDLSPVPEACDAHHQTLRSDGMICFKIGGRRDLYVLPHLAKGR